MQFESCTNSRTGKKLSKADFWKAMKDEKHGTRTTIVAPCTAALESGEEERMRWVLEDDDSVVKQFYAVFTDPEKQDKCFPNDPDGLAKHKAMSVEKRLRTFRDFVKHRASVVAPMCCGFDNNERKLENCHINGCVMEDYDHLPCTSEEAWQKVEQTPEVRSRVLFAYKTIGGLGLRLIVKANPKVGNVADNQIADAQLTGLYEYLDPKCRDVIHLSILPTVENIFYIDDEELFSYYDPEFAELYEQSYREKKTEPLCHKFYDPKADKTEKTETVEVKVSKPEADKTEKTESAADCGYSIGGCTVAEILKARFVTPPEEGFRHDTYLTTAAAVYILCDHNRERAKDVLSQLECLNDYLDEDTSDTLERLVDDGAKRVDEAEAKGERYNLTAAMNDAIRRRCGASYYELRKAARTATQVPDDRYSGGAHTRQQMKEIVARYGERLLQLSEHFENLRRSFGQQRPGKVPAFFVAEATVEATLLTRAHYEFFDSDGRPRESRLNAQAYIIGPSGSGKGCIKSLVELLTTPLKEISDKAVEEYNRWMESGKELTTKPHLPNPIMGNTTTSAKFMEQQDDNHDVVDGKKMTLHLFTFSEELAAVNNKSRDQYFNKHDLEVAAFYNETVSYSTKNSDAKIYNGPCAWNFVVTGTESALNEKFPCAEVENGHSARSIIAPFPDDIEMCSLDMNPDTERKQWLKDAARKPYKVRGLLGGENGFKRLVLFIYEYSKKVHQEAAAEPDKAKANAMVQIVRRAASYGFNLSASSIILRHWDQMVRDADGYYRCPDTFTIDETDEELCEWIMDFARETQWYYFIGKYIQANRVKENEYYAPLNLQDATADKFAQLPDEFTMADGRVAFNMTDVSARSKVNRFVRKGLAVKVSDSRYKGEKTLYRKNKVATES